MYLILYPWYNVIFGDVFKICKHVKEKERKERWTRGDDAMLDSW